ncbi:MAG: UDP-N-acetylmuramoyl-L-alanyl-D-glutamate--2,6-diaminopimelate ligase [Oscillospiraceae bacterium]|jgi:UDP-N-acetylmuramoyl-L-alanyl-D-glutamate--2,6-diaminopimelate ligase|nr:UDP-N-acetylmuramoyl-L-alanyl-D-glutamate--2,6-diaminopimelate ligase [Oscillospiraceae bacterium]
MTLRELAGQVPGLIGISGDSEATIAGLCADTRKTQQLAGSLFFCISGANFDGHTYAAKAAEGGAVALAVERLLPEIDLPQVQVEDVRRTMAHMAAAFYGHPARQLKMLAITGTKGKTTTSYLVKSIIEKMGQTCGLIGTIGNMIGSRAVASALTTPESIDLHALLREMVDQGVETVVMEASAHALDMHRLEGIVFDGVAYTNLSQDHLDYFHTMAAYASAKKRLFSPQYARNCAFNADDETTAFMLEGLTLPYVTFGIRAVCDINARDIEIDEAGLSFVMRLKGMLETPVRLKLTGMFNVYNAMTAAALAMIVGASMEEIRDGIEAVRSVPGRGEVLDTDTPYKVVLDYSHVPAALENILTFVRGFTRNRVIALFGCGGDRDREKRPIMGDIGGRMADFCILTSDNARSEDPFEILEMVEEGIKPTGGSYCVIENRRDAIRYALEIAKPGDVVVLAGKGHETYQEIKGVKQPFDEKKIVAELLAELATTEA